MSAPRAAWWTLTVVLAALPLAIIAARSDSAGAQAAVAPVLSCPAGMALDSATGSCLTQRIETALRPSSCPAGSTQVPGQYGGHVCQTKVTSRVNTGQTQQVYSHTTYANVWVPTGTERVQTGTKRVWIPPRTTVEPLVPPLRVQTGTTRRCDFDPVSGQQYNCRNVPVYGYQTTQTVAVPGYWSEAPIYETRETGYWDRVPTIHYTTEPIYETVVEWVTSAATQGACPSGWQPAGSQCSRTVLGQPSAAPTQSCPSGSVPRYGDALGGTGPSALTCQSSAPGSDTNTGTSQDDSGGSETSPDGGARPLHHLAGESDERLAELGIHRCADGLLSYVACDELPGRTWDSDPGICDGIEGTTYRPDHGGSCVTGSDLLNKCTTPGDCEETTIRTYCPAIGELADTQIQEHAHPDRGAETYRVCIFDCSSFGTLPQYVQSRINGSYDYACLPSPETETSPTDTASPSTTAAATTTSVGPEDVDGAGDPPDTGGPDVTVATTLPTTTTTAPASQCSPLPPLPLVHADAAARGWESRVRSGDVVSSPQRHLPGGGRFLQVAPGRGWMRALHIVQISDPNCTWTVTQVRTAWSELRPWIVAERQRMEAEPSTAHLVERWRALAADQQQLLRQWHRPGAAPAEVVCAIADAIAATASADCGWLFSHPGAYAWRFDACFEVAPAPGQAGSGGGSPPASGDCWTTLASGADWIRPVSDYADGRVTVTQGGTRP
ncbi:MAG: hypothetical protein F4X53_08545 [Acidimicrobiales bacterium]|nr:hypothetical protein [Acidimicrobiales bacterium]